MSDVTLGPPPYRAPISDASWLEWFKQLYVRVGQTSAPPNNEIMLNPMTTLGDTLYENATPGVVRLAGNISATKNFLTQTGTGAVSAAPAWGTIALGDIPSGVVKTIGTFDSQTASTDALVISGSSLYAQSASATKPGMVNNTTQTLGAGTKTMAKVNSTSTYQINGADVITLDALPRPNLFVGTPFGGAFTTATENTVIGTVNAGASITSGYRNVLIGTEVGSHLTTGYFNVGIGVQAFRDLTTGFGHTAVGYAAGASVTTGNNGTFYGAFAGVGITSGSFFTGVGVQAGNAATSGDGITAIGDNALRDTNGAYSSALGAFAGLTSLGQHCTFLGGNTDAATTGLTNVTAVGYGVIPGASNTVILGSGGVKVGIDSITSPTARLHIPAGTATANTAPLKINSGTLLTSPEAGAIEFDGTSLYYTNSTPTRKTISTSSASTPPTVQIFTSGTSQTYTTPAGVVYIRVRMAGPGGGGSSGQSTVGGNNGAAGSTSTLFGSSLLTAGPGGGGILAGAGGAGGTASVAGAATQIIANVGGAGQGSPQGVLNVDPSGGMGGANMFGGAGAGAGVGANAGGAGVANTGGGGGGAGVVATTTSYSGAGGGAGGYVEATIIPTAGQTFTYTVGAGGAGGAAGAGDTGAGGAGAAGIIIVDEYY